MALSPKDRFTFTWQIENFSMCPQAWDECIVSPSFVVESLDKCTWQLKLYPRDDNRIVACYLERIESPDSTEDVKVDFKLSYYRVDSEKTISRLVKGFTFKAKPNLKDNSRLNSLFVFRDKARFWPNDILTIKCELWETKHDTEALEPQHTDLIGPDLGYDITTEIHSTISRDFEKRFINTKCLVRTGIRTEKKSVFWPISNFSSLRMNQRLSLTVASTLKHQPLCLTFYLSRQHTGDLSGQIEIQRDKSNCSEQVFVKCRVSVLHAPKMFQYSIEDEYLFKSNIVNEVWELPSFNQVSSLFKDKYFDESQGVLYLFFEFCFSRLGDEYHVSTDETAASSYQTVVPLNAYNPFQNEFKNLYKDGKFSDSTLLVENRKFKVHKNILSSRSSVFSAMYENDMKEMETGVVEITDLEADTVDRMLFFMYTDILEDLQQEDAVKLYVAADKYSVLPLKYICRYILKNGLDVFNACDVLSLADLHNDNDLLDAIQNFIQINSRKIFHSQKWKDLMKLNSPLSAKVMYKMLT